jgi:hypothetical protein
VVSKRCSKRISFHRFYVHFPFNHPSKDYTQILYFIYKWDAVPVHCDMNFDWCVSIGEIDCLSLILIGFYFPVLRPLLHWSEAVLQHSGNVTLFAICSTCTSAVSRQGHMSTWALGGVTYIWNLQDWGQNATLWQPCFCFSWYRHFAFSHQSEFVWKKPAN